jgi:hypothetical protein
VASQPDRQLFFFLPTPFSPCIGIQQHQQAPPPYLSVIDQISKLFESRPLFFVIVVTGLFINFFFGFHFSLRFLVCHGSRNIFNKRSHRRVMATSAAVAVLPPTALT